MEIYEQIRTDREAGTRRLVAEYRARLQAAAYLLCADEHEAEDLVFRAFERAILKIDDFRPTGSFYYWIYTILLNFYRMDARKKSARKDSLVNGELPEVEGDGHNLFEEFTFRASAVAVRNAVSRLPDTYREVVVLRYFEDMSTPEIAKVAGIPEGTVRSRLHYAKDALYSMLCDTELSPDFADKLVRATSRKGWLFRKAWAIVSSLLALGAIGAGTTSILVDSLNNKAPEEKPSSKIDSSVLNACSWRIAGGRSIYSPVADDVDKSIERALQYLSSNQKEDGTFNGRYGNTAAIPSLAGMAFLSKGYLPGSGKYSETLYKCLDCVLKLADMNPKSRFPGFMGGVGGAMYAHSIGTLFLSEISGMVNDEYQVRIDAVLPHAIKLIVDAQNIKKRRDSDVGGWRYQPNAQDSDLSCSGWALMALRSARLNGADIPDEAIEKAVLYIKRTQTQDGRFSYQSNGGNADTLSGAGILCLELCGRHLDPASLKAAKYLSNVYKKTLLHSGHRYYALYYTSQGLFQLGGDYWRNFESWMHKEYLKRQKPDGSWQSDSVGSEPYATAMTALALAVPYRMLPIYQRDETVDDEEERNEN